MFERFTGRARKQEANRPRIPSPEEYVSSGEYARNQAIFDQFNAEIRANETAREADPNQGSVDDIDPELLEKLRARADGMTGTEWEGWRQDGDRWYDGAGNVAYTRRSDGWYDNTGTRIYDLAYNRVANKP